MAFGFISVGLFWAILLYKAGKSAQYSRLKSFAGSVFTSKNTFNRKIRRLTKFENPFSKDQENMRQNQINNSSYKIQNSISNSNTSKLMKSSNDLIFSSHKRKIISKDSKLRNKNISQYRAWIARKEEENPILETNKNNKENLNLEKNNKIKQNYQGYRKEEQINQIQLQNSFASEILKPSQTAFQPQLNKIHKYNPFKQNIKNK